jgi:hypothetical protein
LFGVRVCCCGVFCLLFLVFLCVVCVHVLFVLVWFLDIVFLVCF